MRSFNCNMYWPLLNMHWEISGFGLGVFTLGGVLVSGGTDDIHVTYVCAYVHIFACTQVHAHTGSMQVCVHIRLYSHVHVYSPCIHVHICIDIYMHR